VFRIITDPLTISFFAHVATHEAAFAWESMQNRRQKERARSGQGPLKKLGNFSWTEALSL